MSEEYKINSTTGNLDKIGQSDADVTSNDARYLKLDQTYPQAVDKGAPRFQKGLVIKAGEKLYFDGA
jgi:hypothetical protein